MVDLCPGNLDVALHQQRLVYINVHMDFKFPTFKANPKPSDESKKVRTYDADSRLKALESVESLDDSDLVDLASKELFGELSPRGIADPPRSKLVSIDAVSLGFKLLPDDPSPFDDSPMVIQSVMNA